MNTIRHWVIISCLMAALVSYGCSTARQSGLEGEGESASRVNLDAFTLSDGDRVVFLGNSLFEKDLRYGLIEYTLATRFHDRDVIFRNLGWSGDTVFGESRGYFTTPPDAYGHLINQLTEAEPTVVFVAYGSIESQEGEEGIPRFREGLERLLDRITELGAEAVLLSPIPHFEQGSPVKEIQAYHEQLSSYSEVLSETADRRGIRFIDLFQPLKEQGRQAALSDNGIHLNEEGYAFLASELERALGFANRNQPVVIDLPEAVRSGGAFSVQTETLPLPTDFLQMSTRRSSSNGPAASMPVGSEQRSYTVRIPGLSEGTYSISADGYHLVRAPSSEWEEGVIIDVSVQQDVWLHQAAELRELIVRKNDLHFQQYRPPNRTYLTGFRSYEQGQNAVELEELGEHIARLEEQIAELRTPRPVRLMLRKIN